MGDGASELLVASTRIPLSLSLLSVLAALLTGCLVGPIYQTPTVATPVAYKELPPAPTGWKSARPNDDSYRGRWWSVYLDPLLNQLEIRIDIDNQNLKVYEAAYRQSLAFGDEARASLYPTLSAGANAGASHVVKDSPTGTRIAAARANWNLDIWGKARRQIESARAGAQASAAELASVRLSAQAELATDYFELRYEDSLEGLLGQAVVAYGRSLEITKKQCAVGTATQSDVATAETQLESTQARLIEVGAGRAQYEHAIALLTGQPPAALSIAVTEFATVLPTMPVTLPSSLLERRPDISQAERLMQHENALIGVAVGAYYPDISLSGILVYTSSQGLILASNPLWSLAAGGSQLVFDGGARSAHVAAARAAYEQSVATYRETVLSAFRDVEDALSSLRILSMQAEVQTQAVMSSQQAVRFALIEYQAGSQTFTTVALAQEAELVNEETKLQIEDKKLKASIALLYALGGGWVAP